jgi:hypothetical protein
MPFLLLCRTRRRRQTIGSGMDYLRDRFSFDFQRNTGLCISNDVVP